MSNFIKRESCPACKSVDNKLLYTCLYENDPVYSYILKSYGDRISKTDFLKDINYTLLKCSNCLLVYQENKPVNNLLKVLYDDTVPENVVSYEAKTSNLDYFSLYANEILMLINFFNKKPSQLNFLDFGMGWGDWCNMSMAFGCNTYGIEFSLIRSEFAKKRGIKTIGIEDLSKFEFDFINTDQVFEHLSNPLDTLIQLATTLKSEGIVKINVPNGNDIEERLKKMEWGTKIDLKKSLMPVVPLEHLNCYSKKSLLLMAAKAGLKPCYIPLKYQYNFIFTQSIKQNLFNLLLPIYRKIYWNSTWGNSCLFFKKIKF